MINDNNVYNDWHNNDNDVYDDWNNNDNDYTGCPSTPSRYPSATGWLTSAGTRDNIHLKGQCRYFEPGVHR